MTDDTRKALALVFDLAIAGTVIYAMLEIARKTPPTPTKLNGAAPTATK